MDGGRQIKVCDSRDWWLCECFFFFFFFFFLWVSHPRLSQLLWNSSKVAKPLYFIVITLYQQQPKSNIVVQLKVPFCTLRLKPKLKVSDETNIYYLLAHRMCNLILWGEGKQKKTCKRYIDRVRLKLNNILSKLLSFYKVPPEKETGNPAQRCQLFFRSRIERKFSKFKCGVKLV